VLVGPTTAFFWSNYLLLATWPISVYLGARLLDWDRWTAAGAAAVSPLLVSASGFGAEHASYLWQGYGLWPQLFGMWLLPIAWGLGWRAAQGRGSMVLTAVVLGITAALHFVLGYISLSMLAIWVVGGHPRQIPGRALRAGLIAAGAVAVAAWELVPLIGDQPWLAASSYGNGTFYHDSFGAAKISGWLLSGQIFDFGRPPVVTILVAIGAAVALWRARRDERSRVILGAGIFSLVLFFGPQSIGPLIKLLPAGGAIPLHRYVMGVHMAGLVLAGVGISWLAARLAWLAERLRVPRRRALVPVAVGVLALAALWPAYSNIHDYDQRDADFKTAQVLAQETDGADLDYLLGEVRSLGGGRVYAGARSNWGAQYTIGYVPVYAILNDQDIDALGFNLRIESLMMEPETLFDESNPAQYDAFNIRYLVLPQDHKPSVPATLLGQRGRHRLYTVSAGSYIQVVDTVPPPLVEDNGNIGAQSSPFMESPQLAHSQYLPVAFNGAEAASPTLPDPEHVAGVAGVVESQFQSLDDGLFSATIVAGRPATALLKVDFDPRMRATVDGVPVATQMLSPAFIGVPVSPGRHVVAFSYSSYEHYPLLFSIAGATLVALAVGPWAFRRLRRARVRAGAV